MRKPTTAEIDRATPIPDLAAPHAVYTYFGLAAWWGQLLELAMLNVVAGVRLSTNLELTDEAYDEAFDDLRKRTLGNLLKTWREAGLPVDSTSEEILGEALLKRNFLMHSFFSSHDAELLDHEEKLVAELREIAAVLAEAQQVAASLWMKLFLRAASADPAFLDRVTRRGLAWERVIMRWTAQP